MHSIIYIYTHTHIYIYIYIHALHDLYIFLYPACTAGCNGCAEGSKCIACEAGKVLTKSGSTTTCEGW